MAVALDVLDALRPRAGAVSDRRPARSAATSGDVAVADGRDRRRSGPSSAARRARRSTRAGCSCCPAWSTPTSTSTSPGRADWEGFATGTAALAAGGDDLRDRHAAQRGPADGRRRRLRRQGRGRDGRRARRLRAVGRARARRPRPPRRARRARRRRLQGVHVGQRRAGVRGRRRPDAARGDGPRGRARACRSPCTPRARSSRAGWRAAPWPRAGSACATTWPRGRSLAELEAIGRAIALAEETGCALHVVHVSSGRGVALVAAGAGARGRRDVRDLPALPRARRGRRRAARRGGQVRAAAARAPTSARRLWAALRAGDVDLVATDHSPAPAALKEGDDFFAVWGGIAGAQTLLALLYDEGVVAPRPRAGGAGRPARRRRRRGASAWRRQGRARGRAPTPTSRSSTRRRRGRWPARSCSTATGSARSWAARCAAASCARSCAGARSRVDGRIVGEPCGRVVRARRLGLCAVSALDDAIAELARFNDDPEAGGITREVYTPTYATALEWVAERMRARGPRDAARRRGQPLRPLGGQRARRAGRASPARTSTRRSTPARYDGVLGVLGAIEAVRALRERGARSAALDRASSPGPARSRASAPAASAAARPPASSQRADLDRLVDRDGTSMADALREAGFDPDRLADARIDPAARARARRAAHRAGHRARDPRRAGRRRHRDRRAARLPPDLPRRRDPRGRHADGPAPRRAGRRGRGDGRARARRARVAQRDDRRHGRRAAARARARSTSSPARSSSTSTCATATSPRASRWSTAIVAAAREIAARRDLEVEVDADRRGRARDLRRGRGGRGRRGACRELELCRPPDDQRRLPRRDDHGPPRAGRHDLRPQRRRRQPPPRRVHRARGSRARRAGAGRDARRGWRPDGLVATRPLRRVSRALRGAYCRIEGREEWRWPARWPLRERRRCPARSPCALRASFATRSAGGQRGGRSYASHRCAKSDHPLGVSKTVAKHARLHPNTHAPEDDDARREPPQPRFPSMMLLGAAQRRKRARGRRTASRAQRGALGFAAERLGRRRRPRARCATLTRVGPRRGGAVELGDAVERDLGDRGAQRQPGDAQAAPAEAHGRLAGGGQQARRGALLGSQSL